jgi:alpha-beta hydrolase superfamily lysophospholipase
MGSGARWTPLARALEGEFDVVMPDSRGHGDSHRAPEIIELQAEARLKTRMGASEVLTPPNPPYRDVVSAIDVPTLLVIGDKPVVALDMLMRSRPARSRTTPI